MRRRRPRWTVFLDVAGQVVGTGPVVTRRAMSNRPRQHCLEAASIKAFSALVPENWSASRPSEHDYGIDLDHDTRAGRHQRYETTRRGSLRTGGLWIDDSKWLHD